MFARTPATSLETLAAACTLKTWDDGARLLSEGDPAAGIFVLTRGVVSVFLASPSGARIVLKVFHAPAVFGEAEALSGVPHLEHVDAQGPCEAIVIPTEDLLALMAEDPSTGLALSIDLSARLAIAIQNARSIAFDPATTRLANFLVECVAWARVVGREPAIALTQDDMAASLGLSRRSVAADIATWQREGVLERRGAWYVVRDLEALRRFSDPGHMGVNYRLSDRLAAVSARLEQRLASGQGRRR